MTHNTWWPVSNSNDESHITSTLYLQHLFRFIQLNHWLTHPRSPPCLVGHSEISFKDTYKPPPAKLISLFSYLLLQLKIPTLQHSSFWLISTFCWSQSPTSDTSSLVVRYNHIYTLDNIEINETRGPQLCPNIHFTTQDINDPRSTQYMTIIWPKDMILKWSLRLITPAS